MTVFAQISRSPIPVGVTGGRRQRVQAVHRRHNRETAPTSRPHLARRKQSPATLVELAADRLPSLPNGVLVDHPTDLRLFAPHRNPQSQVTPTHYGGLRFGYSSECP